MFHLMNVCPEVPLEFTLTHPNSPVPQLSLCARLGEEVLLKVYGFMKQARESKESQESITRSLSQLLERPSDAFQVDQLLYYEELLVAAQGSTVR
ncbi:hypothetical protein DNTS_030913 [Danionella cerebrum]|uniref:Uncharacterized protein n=1 Tax=Danionella cerebrum TaxID=2873325 RepID=A0A553Q800_9TELE|nr:hypothetical protein DNTS_030913 [Danionella translucida]